MCACAFVPVCLYKCICMHVYNICIDVYMCAWVRVYVCVCVCLCVFLCFYLRVCHHPSVPVRSSGKCQPDSCKTNVDVGSQTTTKTQAYICIIQILPQFRKYTNLAILFRIGCGK